MADASTGPYWADSAPFPRFSRCERSEDVDVVVIGGGITGLTTAYELVKEGRSVALFDRQRCAQVDTGHTSAHLTMVTDASLQELVKQLGSDGARAVWDAGLVAIGKVQAIAEEEQIGCGFARIPGYWHSARGRDTDDRAMFEQEVESARTLGFDACLVEDATLGGGPAVMFPHQARFHPRKYLAGLARAIAGRGGHICEHSPVEEFIEEPLGVRVNGCTITCRDIVIATHTPLTGNTGTVNASLFQTKLALYTTYVIAGRVERGRVPDALFWDTAEPYHYLRVEPHRDHDLVIYGGCDHKTGQTDAETADCYGALERDLRSIVPDVDVAYRWSGQVIETPDRLPYIGDTAPHQFAATGFAGNGLTFGTLSAMMACDRILGRANPWQDVFDASRTAFGTGLWTYLRENKDYPYYMLRNWIAGPGTKSLASVRRGHGKVIQMDGQRVAAFRAADGQVTTRSAICTHMGCVVEWNGVESSWDCPCHGSRFDTTGEVFAGPAESPLPEIKPRRKNG